MAQDSNSRTRILAGGIVLVFFVLAAIAIFSALHRRIPTNPDDTTGNTGGNLNNLGLFCEHDGRVYFANPKDNLCMYSMNPDESDLKQVTTMQVRYICAGGKFLYYYMDSFGTSLKGGGGLGAVSNQHGIFRSLTDGSSASCLVREYTGQMQLCGNSIYFQMPGSNGRTLDKISIRKGPAKTVLDDMIAPACYADGLIYYCGAYSDHALYTLDTLHGDTVSPVYNANMTAPLVHQSIVYYLDNENDYRLTRFSLITGETQVLTEDRVDSFNMNDNNLFYATSTTDTPALKCSRLDGSDPVVIAEGIYNRLNLTSRYLYFMPYDSETTLLHVPVDGSSPAAPVSF